MRTEFWFEERRGENYFGGLDIDGRNNTKVGLKEMGCDGVDWIHLAQDWDQWRAIVKTVMNLRVP
jgi:hypothetical protein